MDGLKHFGESKAGLLVVRREFPSSPIGGSGQFRLNHCLKNLAEHEPTGRRKGITNDNRLQQLKSSVLLALLAEQKGIINESTGMARSKCQGILKGLFSF